MQSNQSTVTRRWQTVIPAAIRRQFKINEGDTLMWINDGQSLRVVVIPADPLTALFGRGKGQGLHAKLMAERAWERQHER